MDPRFLAPALDVPVRPGARPSFSVMIAAYQAAATIGEALDSVFAQTEPPQEVIVVDDGSTDDLDGALAPYAGRIRLIRQENAGVAAARNTALRAATGEFVVILDADDVFAPGRLEALGDLAVARPDLDILTTDAYMTLGGRVVRRYYDQGLNFEVDSQRERLLRGNFVYPLAAVRRERALVAGAFDEHMPPGEDWDMWLRLVLDGSRVGLVNEPLAEYRLSESSISADARRMARGCMTVLEKHRADPRLTDRERAVLEAAYADYARELEREDARAALAACEQHARRKSLRIVLGRGHRPATRAKALLAAVAPRAARRRMESSMEQYFSGGFTVSKYPSGRSRNR
ncbi:MAG TPA: glycosyltransferase family A protein [Thermoleophilaceae bacterium]